MKVLQVLEQGDTECVYWDHNYWSFLYSSLVVSHSHVSRNSFYHDQVYWEKKSVLGFIPTLLYLYVDVLKWQFARVLKCILASVTYGMSVFNLFTSSFPLCRYVKTAKEWTTKYATWFTQLWSWQESLSLIQKKIQNSVVFSFISSRSLPLVYAFLQQTTYLSFFHPALIRI